MGLLSGLEKFGLGKHEKEIVDIRQDADAAPEKKTNAQTTPKKEEAVHDEKEFLIRKTIVCPVCDKKFTSLAVRGTKLRRAESDMDLRPRYVGVDVIKYDTVFCPMCGYAAMTQYFEPLSVYQIRRLKEEVADTFRPNFKKDERETLTYEEAIERYNLCLVSAMVKNVKMSEKAYICLKTAWLYRDLFNTTDKNSEEGKAKRAEYREKFNEFYRQAYDGFVTALSQETPPICGMNTVTLEYLIANLAFYFREYDKAYRYLASVIQNKATNGRMKDRSLELRDKISELMKQPKK